jgi:GalNAc-alpha-(1->4)-GalNAc-alpha-(1->3)-diNAcBac-PP-undecaprenol alpha-1,4-N-acetyl-D-galactosaminyltransferase
MTTCMRKKLFCIISSLSGGGAERVMSEIVNYYSQLGVEVVLLTLDPPSKQPAYPLDSAATCLNLPLGRSFFPGLKVIQHLRQLLSLRKIIIEHNPSAVLSFMTTTNILALSAIYGLPIRSVVSERVHPGRHSYGTWANALRRILYSSASSIVVQTTEIEEWMSKRIPGNYAVIPNFVCTPVVTRKEKNSLPVILSLGRLDPQKGFDTLIMSFSLVADHFPEWKLVLVGEGHERKNLQYLIDSLKLNHRIFMPGYSVKPSDYLATASVYVQPSRYEGFPNSLLEAMANGLASIASSEAGYMLIDHGVNGVLVKPEAVDDMAKAIIALIENEEYRMRIGSAASQVIIAYSQDVVMKLWTHHLFG